MCRAAPFPDLRANPAPQAPVFSSAFQVRPTGEAAVVIAVPVRRELGEQLPNARVHCEIVGQQVRLPPDLELAAFRIAQEALSHVRKHAKTAMSVNAALIFEDWGAMFMVEDDGCGFEVVDRDALVRAGHLGLTGMVERAQLFGGELRIVSVPGEGTTVSLRLPWVAVNGSAFS